MFNSSILSKYRYSQIVFIGLLPAILMSIAFFTWLVREENIKTKSSSAANTETVKEIRGIAPLNETIIEGIKPFFGKAGDEVVIWGKDFGYFPDNSYVQIGDSIASNYTKWTDNEIIFRIPENSKSGIIKIVFERKTLNWDKIFTIYDFNTKNTVEYTDGALTFSGFSNDVNLIVWKDFINPPEIISLPKGGFYNSVVVGEKPVWIEAQNADGTTEPFYLSD